MILDGIIDNFHSLISEAGLFLALTVSCGQATHLDHTTTGSGSSQDLLNLCQLHLIANVWNLDKTPLTTSSSNDTFLYFSYISVFVFLLIL